MKLVNYTCEDCGFQKDEFYMSFEDVRTILNQFCPKCGGTFRKWNFKNNKQQWKFNDIRK